MTRAAVIGGGPAGLAAAEVLSARGVEVVVFEAMPSVARKLLMAGKSGLNLTKSEPREAFLARVSPNNAPLADALTAFGPEDIMAWAEGLGQPMFVGSSGRVFPLAMKASPMLRAWLARLNAQGVEIRTRHRWIGANPEGAQLFETAQGVVAHEAKATVFALGGASWPRLGSDGAWASQFPGETEPFAASNAGIAISWSAHMRPVFGQPLKTCALSDGKPRWRGEAIITPHGLEGGLVYPASPAVRANRPLTLDLAPDLTTEQIQQKWEGRKKGQTLSRFLKDILRFDAAKRAIFFEFRPDGAPAEYAKALPLSYSGLAPMEGAISTVGGLRLDAITADLMLKSQPGWFAAGEMLDWDAPTGGYLLTTSIALGRKAGEAAADWLSADNTRDTNQQKP